MNRRGVQLGLVLSLSLWVCTSGDVAAQQVSTAEGVPVHMVVSVEAHRGSNVPVIDREDVMVYEGHDRDKVVDWVPAQGDHSGLELFVLLDDGSGMNLGTQLEEIRKFILSQPASTKIGVAYMQDGVARIEQNLTADHALAAKALRLPLGMSDVNGSPYFSLSDLIKKWPESQNRREVFMATDGIDRYYGGTDLLDPYLSAAIADAQRAGVLVYAVYTPGAGHDSHNYWRSYWGQLYLARLTDETGGESYYIGYTGAPVTFTPYLDNAANRWSHQYLLTFLAKPEKKAGLQRVKITTEVSNAELVSAGEVYVPAAQ